MKICYFGIYKDKWPRDEVYLKGLKINGSKIIECIDTSNFLISKMFKLAFKHFKICNKYDIILVGYLSNIVVPLARLISNKKIIYNALCSMYEGVVLDRKSYKKNSLGAYCIWFIDFLAFHSAHLILIESAEQKKFIMKKFYVKGKKISVIFTGADNQIFYSDLKVSKNKIFSVVFRGWFLPATGIEHVIEAAKILKDKDINFLIIGRGILEEKIKKLLYKYNLKNVELITEFLADDVLRKKMLSCHVCLGQFANHPRMDRTIQNKTYEALALGMPYITRDSLSNREILEDQNNCLFVKPADPEDLAEKILELENNLELRKKIAENGYELYKEKLNPRMLGKQLLDILSNEIK